MRVVFGRRGDKSSGFGPADREPWRTGWIVLGFRGKHLSKREPMLDQPSSFPGDKLLSGRRPRLDFQDHLADLEAEGLLVRIDRLINKDTELHPLVRWQFLGGVPEAKRRAFLFSNVTDAKGRH